MIAQTCHTRAPVVTVLVESVRSTDTDADILEFAKVAVGRHNLRSARMSRDLNDPTRAVVTLERNLS